MTQEKALEAGFLENKRVYVRLIAKEGQMIKDPKHIGYGGFDGAITNLTLAYDINQRKFVNPFSSDDERKYFEEVFKTDLSVYTQNNQFWKDYMVTIRKDSELVHVGMPFDLSDPKDALAIKVLKTNKNLVVTGWENRFNLPTYKYAIIDEGYEEVQKSKEMDLMVKIGAFLGKMEDSATKMRDFLSVYHATKKKAYIVNQDMTKEALKAEIMKIISIDQKGYISLVEDKNYETKVFISHCIDKGLIKKEGLATYYIVGVDKEYEYITLVDEIARMAEEKTDPIYAKMIGQIKAKK